MDNILLGVVAFVGLFLLSLLGIGAMTSFSFLDVRAGANYLPYDSGRPIHIVWWTDNRHGDSRSALHLPQPWGRVEHNLTGLRAGEPFRCVVEGSREAATGMTDALLWEPVYRGAANLPAEVPPRFEHQLWVHVDEEAEIFAWATGPEGAAVGSLFNMTMSQGLQEPFSHVRVEPLDRDPVFKGSREAVFEPVALPAAGRQNAFLFVEELCDEQKLAHLRHLSIHFRIDAYGACFHNQAGPPIHLFDPAANPEHSRLVSSYRYFLLYPASSSSPSSSSAPSSSPLCPQHVPEIYWHLLRLGTIPVVIGSIDRNLFEPVSGVLQSIDPSQNLHPQLSALRKVVQNPSSPETLFAWKQLPLSKLNPAFVEHWLLPRESSADTYQRLALF